MDSEIWTFLFKQKTFFLSISVITRFILYQLLNRGILEEINGCVSTGKEVYCFCLHMMFRRMCIMELV